MIPQKITNVLVSIYNKKKAGFLLDTLANQGVRFLSTGGTKDFIQQRGHSVEAVENVTNYPSLFGGRVKTLHPAIFGGLLFRRDDPQDVEQASQQNIIPIDMIIVDLYPFQEAVERCDSHEDIIEKIDIGGVSLIRAAVKNYRDVLTVSSPEEYDEIIALLQAKKGYSTLEERKKFATQALETVLYYDRAIFHYFSDTTHTPAFDVHIPMSYSLRYGENPHQSAVYYGDLNELLEQLHGTALSYNNMVDIEATLQLLGEFDQEIAFVIVKHTNACGVALGDSVKIAYQRALATDPLSAFGGVLASNKKIDLQTAQEINALFFEVLIAPDYEPEALTLLKTKKKRRLIRIKKNQAPKKQFKSILNGVLEQECDIRPVGRDDLIQSTKRKPSSDEMEALLFANKIVKHTKSNAIVLATKNQLIASGVGQTSRVDALRHAIEKANRFHKNINHVVMASDAFFPFPDCVEIAHQAGIKAVIQPGGSVKDSESIDFCDCQGMAMVMTNFRHFRH